MNILVYFYCYLLNPTPLSQTCIENNSPNSCILCSNLIFFHTFVKILTKPQNFNVLSNFWVYLSKVTRKFVLIFNDMGKSPLKAKFHSKIRQASRHLSKQTNYIWNGKAMVSPILCHERTYHLSGECTWQTSNDLTFQGKDFILTAFQSDRSSSSLAIHNQNNCSWREWKKGIQIFLQKEGTIFLWLHK